MQHVTQQKNFGRGRVINMKDDFELLIQDIKNGNVQDLDWNIMLKLIRYLIQEREHENDLK